jgi:hypothetical protein
MNTAKKYSLTQRSIRVTTLSILETQRKHQDFVSTEQLLLALIRHNSGTVAAIFESANISLATTREDFDREIPSGTTVRPPHAYATTPQYQAVFEYAAEEARMMGNDFIDLEHILLGLMRDQNYPAARYLKEKGLEFDAVRSKVAESLSGIKNEMKVRQFHFSTLLILMLVASILLGLNLRPARVTSDRIDENDVRLVVVTGSGWPVAKEKVTFRGMDAAEALRQYHSMPKSLIAQQYFVVTNKSYFHNNLFAAFLILGLIGVCLELRIRFRAVTKYLSGTASVRKKS